MEDMLLNWNSSSACGHAVETAAVSDLWGEFDAPSYCAAHLPPSENKEWWTSEWTMPWRITKWTAENTGFSNNKAQLQQGWQKSHNSKQEEALNDPKHSVFGSWGSTFFFLLFLKPRGFNQTLHSSVWLQISLLLKHYKNLVAKVPDLAKRDFSIKINLCPIFTCEKEMALVATQTGTRDLSFGSADAENFQSKDILNQI